MTRDDPATLHELAAQCRSLARGASTREVRDSLNELAQNYDELAKEAEAAAAPVPQAPTAH
jgi:hypothetical protein